MQRFARRFRCGHDPHYMGYLGRIDVVSTDTVFRFGPRSSLLISHDQGVNGKIVQPYSAIPVTAYNRRIS